MVGTTTTAADGSYNFTGLAAGSYSVVETQPANYLDGKDTAGNGAAVNGNDRIDVTLVAGDDSTNNNFGELPKPAQLSGFVYVDAGNDGVKGAGETAISGVTLNLLNASGATVGTTTTNDSGYYEFKNLAAGTYSVVETQPANYLDGKDTAGSTGGTVTNDKISAITLKAGDNSVNNNFGELLPTASLGDQVWLDKDGDGVQDSGESGISGVKVTLTGGGKDGLLSTTGDNTTATTTTNSSGNYSFTGLAAGEYQVKFDASTAGTGYVLTRQNAGSNDTVDSDADRTTGMSQTVKLAAGENNTTVDAGVYQKASVGDKVWDDMNHNNLQDSSEPGIAGITVKLITGAGRDGVFGTSDDIIQSTTKTDNNGNYKFTNLDPGTYVLLFDKTNVQHYNYGAWYNMSNWKWAVKDVGTNDAIDSDVTGDAKATTNVTVTSPFTLTSGQNDMTKDAGITPIAIDLNGDGIHTVARADSSATFDLLGNGTAIQSGWLSGEDGFLAVDTNGNGLIDGISELFGGLNKGDGFAKLTSFDSNGDGLVNAADQAFASLKIWQDINGNHQTDAGELLSLMDAGVTSLSTGFNELPFLDAQGNLLLERSSATLADGHAVEMTDVYFNVSTQDTAGVEVQGLASLMGADSFWIG